MAWDSVAGSSAVEVLELAVTKVGFPVCSLHDFEECEGHSSSVPPVSIFSSKQFSSESEVSPYTDYKNKFTFDQCYCARLHLCEVNAKM